MPDQYMNLTDEEAAALGYREAVQSGPERQRHAAGPGVEPAYLVAGVVIALLTVVMFAAFNQHPAAPEISNAPAQQHVQEPPPVMARQAPQRTPAPSPHVSEALPQDRPEESTKVTDAVANPPAFPSPAILALGWRCAYMVEAVTLFDAPAGNPIGVLPLGAQLYVAPYFQGCWTQILSKEGHVLGYACVHSQEPQPGVVSSNVAPQRTEAGENDNPAAVAEQVDLKLLKSLVAHNFN